MWTDEQIEADKRRQQQQRRQQGNKQIGEMTFTLAFVVLCCVVFVMSRGVDPDRAREVLESEGYVSIELSEDYPWFECGEYDVLNTTFSARNVQGRPVEGVVCCGRAKRCTVRF